MTGPTAEVDRFTSHLRVLETRQLGPTRSATVYGTLTADDRRQATRAGLEIGPVALQDLFVHLTEPERPLTDTRSR